MTLDKDTSQILIAELKVAWHKKLLDEVISEVSEWWVINSEDEDQDQDEDFLHDLSIGYFNTFVKLLFDYDEDDSYDLRDKLYDLEVMFATARRLCECIKHNAWVSKPCWVVYEKLLALTDKFDNQSINTSPEYLERLENAIALLSDDVASIRYELDDVEDFIDLTDEDREWFKEIADRLDVISLDKSGHLYDGLYILYDSFIPVRKYIKCQGKTNKEPCLHELGELCKKVGIDK